MLNPYQHGLPVQVGQPPIDWDTIQRLRELAGQVAPHAADYVLERGDFAPIKRGYSSIMEADSTSNKNARNSTDNNSSPMDVTMARSGNSSGFGAGYRGKFVGTTSSNKGYEKHYHEMYELHGKKQMNRALYWGLSRWTKQTNAPKLTYWTKDWVYLSDTEGLPNNSIFSPWGYEDLDWTDYIYSQPINFKLGDFVDNKLLSDNGLHGMMRSYKKLRLKSFTVEVTPVSYQSSLTDTHQRLLQDIKNDTDVYGSNYKSACPFSSNTYKGSQESDEPQPVDYWIFRDIYGDYIDKITGSDTFGFIPHRPRSAWPTATQEDFPSRTTRAVRNLDRNLCIVKSKETFSFTREINSNGSYYLEAGTVGTNFNKPIHQLVNELEGQTKETGDIAEALPEYFHLLIAPTFMPIQWGYHAIKQTNSSDLTYATVPYPCLKTILHIKCQSKWEAFDFQYQSSDPIGRSIEFEMTTYKDPLIEAEYDHRAAKLLQKSHLNRGVK